PQAFKVELLSLVAKGRRASNHPQLRYLGKAVNQTIRNTVGEVLRIRIGSHVDERQDNQGLYFVRGCAVEVKVQSSRAHSGNRHNQRGEHRASQAGGERRIRRRPSDRRGAIQPVDQLGRTLEPLGRVFLEQV